MLLIDAHFASLVVLPAGRLLITALAGHIEEHKQLAEKVTPLKGVLVHYQKHAKKARGSAAGGAAGGTERGLPSVKQLGYYLEVLELK